MTHGPFNLAEYVLSAGTLCPDKTALEVLDPAGNGLRMSHGALRAAVLGTARGILDVGLRPGDRVLMRLGNTPDFPIAYLGAIAAGVIPAPSSAALTLPEVAHLIETLAPKAVLHDDRVACPDHPMRIDLEALRGMRARDPAAFARGDPDRPAYIIFTSGTSGQPRGVVHAHRAILARRMMFDGWYGLRATDRMLHAGAFNWTFTLGTGLLDPWTIGATALVTAPGLASTALPGLLEASAATLFAAAPGVYRQMLRAPVPPLPALRHGLSAGEKLPEPTRLAWMKATGTPIHEAFGMSEISTFISSAPDALAPPGTLGRPQPGRRVALMGPDGPVAPGDAGVIAVNRSDPGLMLGYLDQPDETAARFQGEWFLTGDLGHADADGNITYLGRDDDMMNAGGLRVSPLEVEAVLNAHPGVTASAVVELPVSSGASIVGAFYTGPQKLDDAVLKAYVAPQLARYKCPRAFHHVGALPMGANGKLMRRKLRETWKGE